jgi:hypothetical protein
MWDEIINEAENVVKENLETWMRNDSVNVAVYGGKWKEMLDEDIMMVSREFRFTYDRLPFVITKIDGVGEGVIGFEGGSFGIDTYTVVESGVLPDFFDFSNNVIREIVFVDIKGNQYKYVVAGGMFSNPVAVTPEQLASVLKDQSNGNVGVLYDNDAKKIRLKFLTYKVTVIKDDVFGLSGDFNGVAKWRNGVCLRGTLTLTVGCQSPVARSELKDLLGGYFNGRRKLIQNGVIGSSEKVEIIINSMIRGIADSDVPIGGGDMLKMLYLGGYSMDVLINAVDEGEIVDSELLAGISAKQIAGFAHDC